MSLYQWPMPGNHGGDVANLWMLNNAQINVGYLGTAFKALPSTHTHAHMPKGWIAQMVMYNYKLKPEG